MIPSKLAQVQELKGKISKVKKRMQTSNNAEKGVAFYCHR